jgi:nucleoside-diphosphate-sugar epimerase
VTVAITGGLSQTGEYLIPELAAAGHDPVCVDLAVGAPQLSRYRQADISDFGETLHALDGAGAVVHLARHGSLGAPERLFGGNVMQTWNVLQAAEILGVGKVVLASSVNAVGAAFNLSLIPPEYLPLDEAHPTRAQDPYSLSKWVGEQIADGFARRRRVQIASFRLHALMRDGELAEHCPARGRDPERHAGDFWSYTSLRDAARAMRLALEAEWEGHEVFFVNAADTCLTIPTADAIRLYYPTVGVREELPGFMSAISTRKAGRYFDWHPLVSWRDAVMQP